MPDKIELICISCEHFDREYAPECASCQYNRAYIAEPVVEPVLELDDGCRWVPPHPPAL